MIERVFADWESLDSSEAADLFPYLAQSSAGSLQARLSGTCLPSELRDLLKKELGIQIP